MKGYVFGNAVSLDEGCSARKSERVRRGLYRPSEHLRRLDLLLQGQSAGKQSTNSRSTILSLYLDSIARHSIQTALDTICGLKSKLSYTNDVIRKQISYIQNTHLWA